MVTQTQHPRKIYLATSWRNQYYPFYLDLLRQAGHEVYDFRDNDYAFKWSGLNMGDPFQWDKATYLRALKQPEAYRGFNRDFEAMQAAQVGVLLMPCGEDAHLELGWMVGKGKFTIIHYPEGDYSWGPGLMKKLASVITLDPDKLLGAIERAPV